MAFLFSFFAMCNSVYNAMVLYFAYINIGQ